MSPHHSPPQILTPSSLSSLAFSLQSLLAPHLPSCNLAIYLLPPILTLPLIHLFPHLNITPIFLNSRWNPTEAAAAAKQANPHALLLPYPQTPATYTLSNLLSIPILYINPTPLTLIPGPVPIPALAKLSRSPHLIFFTSGTTSVPKPVHLSYQSLLLQARAKIPIVPYQSDSVYLHLVSHFTVGGFSSALALTLVGATHVFLPPGMSLMAHAADVLHIINKHHVNTVVVVPTLLRLLVDVAEEGGHCCQGVRSILYGASAVGQALRNAVARVFPGARLLGAYGMTETASSMTFIDHSKIEEHSNLHASVGWPMGHVEMAIGNTFFETGRWVGEVLTRGPHLMQGYVGGHARGMSAGSWMRTGDLGWIDEQSGALFLIGRLKDMIKTGGENVFAGEVEEMLVGCEGVREAAVVGVPHRVLGEAVAAAVVLVRGGKGVGEVMKSVRNFCNTRLSGFKRPRWILEEQELPRNATGKVVKSEVRERLTRRIGASRAKL